MQLVILNSTNNYSIGSDAINIRHFKHLWPLAIRYFINMYNIPLNTNTIPHLWKHATIIFIPKPNKDCNIGTNYQPISLLSPIAKTLEKVLLPYITENIPIIFHQDRFRHKHATHTTLSNICHQITKGFNNPRPPQCTVAVALDMSKVFHTVNIHKLLHKLTLTNILNIIIKFIANYMKGQQPCTQYNGILSKLKQINTKVPQGGVLFPTLFNICTSTSPKKSTNHNIC